MEETIWEIIRLRPEHYTDKLVDNLNALRLALYPDSRPLTEDIVKKMITQEQTYYFVARLKTSREIIGQAILIHGTISTEEYGTFQDFVILPEYQGTFKSPAMQLYNIAMHTAATLGITETNFTCSRPPVQKAYLRIPGCEERKTKPFIQKTKLFTND